jgi:DNA-binding transcriptional LysR family regulator
MNPRDIRSLDIGMLRAFEALMRERSVSRAAARLFLSQPAVSAALNRLRETFDDPLFTRTPHGVTPTPRAQALAPQVEKVLADIGRLFEPDQPFDPAQSSRIFRIAGSDHASRLLLAPLTRLLTDAGSSVRLLWEAPGSTPVTERLQQGELDVAVLARIRRPQDVQTQVLYSDHYVYVLRKGHPGAGEPVTLDSFCATPQIFLGYGTSTLDDLIDDTLARAGRQRLAQVAVSSFGQILHQLRHSDHAAVLGRRVATQYADELHIQPLPFELPGYDSLLCWAERFEADAGIRWLRERIAQVMAAVA